MLLTSPKSKPASCPHHVHGNYFVACARKSLSGDSNRTWSEHTFVVVASFASTGLSVRHSTISWHNLIAQVQHFPCPVLHLHPVPNARALAQRLGNFQTREAVSGEPQKLCRGAKRVQLGSYPDESITSLNDWPQDLVAQSISLPGPE